MNDEQLARFKNATGGAVGAGLVLIVMPSIALFLGLGKFAEDPLVGLPVLAIFGIMILFGSLSLIATLFARLGLSDARQALALPEGSIRAAISLSLIVLFAIIAIMLYRSLSQPYEISGLSESEKTAIVKDPANRVLAVVPKDCARRVMAQAPATTASAAIAADGSTSDASRSAGSSAVLACPKEDVVYSVFVKSPPSQESNDLAKQLLVLIGTLMTSVTSFYFASRATQSAIPESVSGSNSGSTPTVNSVNPNPILFEPDVMFSLKLIGTGFDAVAAVWVERDGVELKPVQTILKRTSAECTFLPTALVTSGEWTVMLVDHAGRAKPQVERVTLTQKSG